MDPPVRQQVGWSPGQKILNDAGAREPEHRLDPPAPVVAWILWATARSTSTLRRPGGAASWPMSACPIPDTAAIRPPLAAAEVTAVNGFTPPVV
jgi:hypothetical protein